MSIMSMKKRVADTIGFYSIVNKYMALSGVTAWNVENTPDTPTGTFQESYSLFNETFALRKISDVNNTLMQKMVKIDPNLPYDPNNTATTYDASILDYLFFEVSDASGFAIGDTVVDKDDPTNKIGIVKAVLTTTPTGTQLNKCGYIEEIAVQMTTGVFSERSTLINQDQVESIVFNSGTKRIKYNNRLYKEFDTRDRLFRIADNDEGFVSGTLIRDDADTTGIVLYVQEVELATTNYLVVVRPSPTNDYSASTTFKVSGGAVQVPIIENVERLYFENINNVLVRIGSDKFVILTDTQYRKIGIITEPSGLTNDSYYDPGVTQGDNDWFYQTITSDDDPGTLVIYEHITPITKTEDTEEIITVLIEF